MTSTDRNEAVILASRGMGRYTALGGAATAGVCPQCHGWLAAPRGRDGSEYVGKTRLTDSFEVALVDHLDYCPDEDRLPNTLEDAVRALEAGQWQ